MKLGDSVEINVCFTACGYSDAQVFNYKAVCTNIFYHG